MGFSWSTDVAPTGGPLPPSTASLRTLLALALAVVFGAALAALVDARPAGELPPCLCGHDARAHEHLRPGTWCAHCRPWKTDEPCSRYEPVPVKVRARDEATAAEFLRKLAVATRPLVAAT